MESNKKTDDLPDEIQEKCPCCHKSLTKEQLELLKKPLPPEAIKPHPTKTYLSSIKAIYVTERFNEVFGVGAWTTKLKLIKFMPETGMIVIKTTFEVPDYNIYYECYGGNDNGGVSSKNYDLGDAFKGATTDALTKIGSWMGVGIDVFKGKVKAETKALYDKRDDKKWLNPGTPDWTNALQKQKTLKEVLEFYRVSVMNQKKYEEDLNFVS